MSYKNPKQLMDAATALPIAIEAKLPEGAPKISTKLLDFNDKALSKLPDFLFELPDLPAVPELPGPPGEAGLRRRYVSAVEVRPVPVRTREAPIPTRVTQSVGGGRIIEGRGF